ncbi:MAG: glutamine amidotransferase, partial [Pirellulaceae bacterium]|nr:glutamine amidotransferase [Pirellulaceae bacterium]
MSQWFFQPILNSYALVAAIAAALVLLLLIGPGFRRLTRSQRLVLTALRLVVIGLVVLAMLRPTHLSTTRRQQTAVLIVLFDQSRSMLLPQASGGASRWSVQQDLLRQAEPVLRDLSKNMAVKVYGFGAGIHPLPWTGDSLPLPKTPDGQQTDIGTSLHAALQRELGQRLAGVVLLGDGVQTAFRPSVEIPEAGRELARLGYPLYAVPFGQPLDAVQARDVAVENLQDQYTVFVKNELPVTAMVAIRGCTNQTIPVQLRVEKPGGEVDVVGPVNVVARADEEQVAIELRYVPEQPGNYRLTVEAAEQPGELVTKNNRLSAFLRVLEGGLKLLYLEGELREEQLFLRRVLEASPDMDLEFLWLDPRQRDKWPVDIASRLRDAKYDAFIVGDLDAAALGKDQLQLLAEAVGRGKGLALLGGYHSFGAGGYFDTPLADVMPITMDRLERQDFDAPLRQDLHLAGPLRIRPAGSHPLTSLASDAENAAAWERLPPLAGANKFVAVKEAAGVRVVAETDAGQPLLVVGEYGRGRVAAMAGDSTYRWAMRGFDSTHRRFWRQVILWLVGR